MPETDENPFSPPSTMAVESPQNKPRNEFLGWLALPAIVATQMGFISLCVGLTGSGISFSNAVLNKQFFDEPVSMFFACLLYSTLGAILIGIGHSFWNCALRRAAYLMAVGTLLLFGFTRIFGM